MTPVPAKTSKNDRSGTASPRMLKKASRTICGVGRRPGVTVTVSLRPRNSPATIRTVVFSFINSFYGRADSLRAGTEEHHEAKLSFVVLAHLVHVVELSVHYRFVGGDDIVIGDGGLGQFAGFSDGRVVFDELHLINGFVRVCDERFVSREGGLVGVDSALGFMYAHRQA